MDKQTRIEAIERIIKNLCDFKPSGNFKQDCERWEVEGGVEIVDIATAIEEAIGVDEDKIYEMLDGFSYKSPRTGYTKIITLKETSQKMSKAISTNKEVIKIEAKRHKE